MAICLACVKALLFGCCHSAPFFGHSCLSQHWQPVMKTPGLLMDAVSCSCHALLQIHVLTLTVSSLFAGGLPFDLTEGDVLCVFSQYVVKFLSDNFFHSHWFVYC